jgi:carboxylate-amine ligase
MWMVRENKWRASRWGLDADLVVADTGVSRPLRQDVCELIERLAPHAERVEATVALAGVTTMLGRPPSYERQRALFERHESLVPVADALIAECETDTPVV